MLPVSFWRRFAAIENVVAIKMAPFNRYRTLDVIRGVVEAGAQDRVTLYTGNDDHIVLDLVTPFSITVNGKRDDRSHQGRPARTTGACGRKAPVELLARIHGAIGQRRDLAQNCSRSISQVTDCNAAIFDVANDFHGVHLPAVTKSCAVRACSKASGASTRTKRWAPASWPRSIRVCATYPHLTDDAFVRANVARWLA